MKKIILLSAFAASLFAGKAATAQVRVSVNFGAPAYYDDRAVYANDADYYYMPECGAYYNPVRRLYFYNEGGRWMSAAYLPGRFNGYRYGRGNWTRVQGRAPWMRGGNDRGYGNRSYGYGGGERAQHYNHRDGGFQSNGGYRNGGDRGGYRNDNGGYRNENGGQRNGNGGYRNGGNSGYQNGGNRGGDRGGNQNGGGYQNGGNTGGNQNGGNGTTGGGWGHGRR